MNKAETFRRDSAPAGSYRARKAQELFRENPTIHTVEFWERGSGGSAADPRPGTICYVMSTGGKFGKGSECRMHPQDTNARLEAYKARQRQQATAPFEQNAELQAYLQRGCFRLGHTATGMVLSEVFHDTGTGGMTWIVRTPAEALERIQSALPGHESVYHRAVAQ